MNVPAASGQDIFDVRKIRRLVEFMKEHDLTEIDLHQGEVRIQLRRAGTGMPSQPAPGTGAAGVPSGGWSARAGIRGARRPRSASPRTSP